MSCKRATLLIEKNQLQGKLSVKQTIQLKMHTALCDACKGYETQSQIIDKGLETYAKRLHTPKHKLSKKVKDGIIKAIGGKT
ncbi:MAG: hypothetical protein ACJAVN_001445 [Roseivirga sp.]|jgi:hypothetical protein